MACFGCGEVKWIRVKRICLYDSMIGLSGASCVGCYARNPYDDLQWLKYNIIHSYNFGNIYLAVAAHK